eukprot:6185723-Pleurochrysis_carterae.AAC.1
MSSTKPTKVAFSQGIIVYVVHVLAPVQLTIAPPHTSTEHIRAWEMSAPYYYPFLDSPSQGDLHSTRLLVFDRTSLGIFPDQTARSAKK